MIETPKLVITETPKLGVSTFSFLKIARVSAGITVIGKTGKILTMNPVKVNSAESFSSTVYDVLPGTTYYVKAFMIANSIPYYGDEKSFTTPVTLVLPVVDIDHNIYYPVNIGDQTWLNSNLKTTHYPDGSVIEHIEDRITWFFICKWSKVILRL